MDRLTMTSDKGGVALTFDLDITCKPSEIKKILHLAERLKAYEETDLTPEEAAELFEARLDGRLVVLPCKRGDIINRFYWSEDAGITITSDTVTKVVPTRRGFTIYTKKMFRPIRTEEYDIALVSEYPYALADFYIGTRDDADAALKSHNPQQMM